MVEQGRAAEARGTVIRVLVYGFLVTLMLEIGLSFADRVYDWYLAELPQENVFFYEEIGLVEEQPGGLLMYSIASRGEQVDRVIWSDRLRCGQTRRVTATQQTSADNPDVQALSQIEWDFYAPIIDAWIVPQECVMESNITVTKSNVRWSQRITSEPFLIGGP